MELGRSIANELRRYCQHDGAEGVRCAVCRMQDAVRHKRPGGTRISLEPSNDKQLTQCTFTHSITMDPRDFSDPDCQPFLAHPLANDEPGKVLRPS